MLHIHPFLIAQLLLLLALANGAPLVAKKLFGTTLANPVDKGVPPIFWLSRVSSIPR
jgi:hypothetical protein